MIFGTVVVTVLASLLTENGSVAAHVQFQSPEKTEIVYYLVRGCRYPNNRFVLRDKFETKWVYDGAGIVDQIATTMCKRHYYPSYQ